RSVSMLAKGEAEGLIYVTRSSLKVGGKLPLLRVMAANHHGMKDTRLALSLRSPISQDRASSSIPRLTFAFPVIVIDSPLVECSRKQDGEFELIEVSNSEFLFSAHVPDYIGCSVKVITKEHLPDFAE
ncbi:MAG: hypothetical protein Q7U50_12080, partial [Candidatus Nitrotoga sp.]|nr:hypothetical protein [Candidatus Nitrotoga sp.]MDP3496751.1 hypothetical protein [Candidatus Nitrotoga sp.]